MEQFLTYGLFAESLKHISKVENGLACKCVCANCKHPLVAKNNPKNKKVAHFAHQSGKECDGAIETALHLLAKAILQKTKRITLPKYHYDYDHFNEESIFNESSDLVFENVILEKVINFKGDKIIPDAIGEKKDRQILIEFANTHFVDHDKKKKLKKLGIACIEIDLREQPLDEEWLTELLNTDNDQKYWIINQKLDKKYKEHKKIKLKKENLRIQRQVAAEQKQIKDAESKFKLYKYNKAYRLFRLKNDEVTNCPLKRDELSKLKTSNFYRQEVLKKIIEGEYWNGQLYGNMPNGCYIYLKNCKVIVYPPDEKRGSLTEQENKKMKLFYAGLLQIKKILENSNIGNCTNCKFSVDYFSYDKNDYEVCKHPNE